MRLAYLHESVSQAEVNKRIYKLVYRSICDGDNKMATPLKNRIISIVDIITAINNNRCLDVGDFDVGSTYLAQQVGGAIRDAVPVAWVSYARSLFGLPDLSS
jgi:hypothetical protein